MNDKKRGLGRGLSALIAPSDTSEATRSLPIAQIQPNRLQPRTEFDDSQLEELAASIRAQGLIQPLIVSPTGKGTYTIVAGERRWRAAQRAGLTVVPVVVRQVRDDRELLELALVENLQRSDLNPMEEAEAYRTLQENFQLSQEEIAARVGKARPAVANTLRLLKLPPAIQDFLRSGRLTAGQVRPLLAINDPERQQELAERALREGLSSRSMEELASGKKPGAKSAKGAKKSPEPHAAAAAERLTQKLQTRVEIDRRGKGGTIRIHFHSEEELIRLYERITEPTGPRDQPEN
ncbi:MAG: ParB/RepB/Spo0J family partition protein [Thermoanaerobaculia bacterium]|jgi:ParB family chromosome partitioning protein|nr:ParB/RepB/Spo0J family partition protein [Thermoanaerobaculia bacterium]